MKRHIIVAAAAAAFFAASTSAWAWNEITGRIMIIDAGTHRIILDDGKTYVAQKNVNLARLKIGDRVTLTTEEQNGTYIVNKVTKG